ncbi:hypothetical protein [Xanthomonas citri]|uniref:hypothetical protein n=1 Tax=Xanthomonas citri TaxID=346 RepID=UPI000F5A918E|nr:hypothetical protein [Xanthomonas citri]QDS12140.1 hypothetical protein FPL03_14120 [Xanthomonas citri pv. glycines]QTK33196.1 hypothetical protein XcgCFBP2526_13930 [Xanthomonas citri pv. glycines CFBP 2526]QTK37613.1 hypothetical protein XcgCFBP7119R_14670 [Xanthomonas citri pv. glycines]TSK00828.1 hypothetical protein FPL06_11050 [Xanthomonas citri pv. glycines]UIX77583.1 hypothetical protein LMJ37_08665 [Xanthomonas citri pv. glycines]
MILVTFGFLLVGACGQVDTPQEREAVSQQVTDRKGVPDVKLSSDIAVENSSAPVESTDIAELSAKFKEGMAYGDLRKEVIAGNWKPVISAECKKNVVGDDFEGICSNDPERCLICDDVPELNICSGDGHCITEFSSADHQKLLKVSTYGEIQDALVEDEKSRLFVSWWDVSPKAN